jgi:hypothetical protein
MLLTGGETAERLELRNVVLTKFCNVKSAILCYVPWTTSTLTDIPCTQAIEVGIPISQGLQTQKRMHMLQQACESTSKTGRFITVTHPHEMERGWLPQPQQEMLNNAENYQYIRSFDILWMPLIRNSIDFTESVKLFRQRFNQLIRSAFDNVSPSTRKALYSSMVHLNRHDFAEQSDNSEHMIKDLHRCAVLMGLSKEQILDVNTNTLVKKMSAAWLVDGQTDSGYGQPGIEEAMCVLGITTATKTSLPEVEKKIKVDVVDLTEIKSEGNVIDLTMED